MLLETENKSRWLFPDTEGLPMELHLREAGIFKGKQDIPCLFFDSNEGLYLASIWKIKGLDSIKKVLGNDTTAWNGKLFKIYAEAKQLHIKLMEESI